MGQETVHVFDMGYKTNVWVNKFYAQKRRRQGLWQLVEPLQLFYHEYG